MYTRLRELREERKITQMALSLELGVSQETISLYERGRHLPSIQHLLKLSSYFGVSIDYILCLSPSRFSVESGNLTDEEAMLISIYRSLPKSAQSRFNSYLQGLADAASK